MAKNSTKRPSEEELLKALGALETEVQKGKKSEDESEGEESSSPAENEDESASEEAEKGGEENDVEKADPNLPKTTKQANGGMSQKDSDDEENFETNAEDNDPTTGKSMSDRVRSNSDIKKGMDISPFLESLVQEEVASFEALAKSVTTHMAEERAFRVKIAKALSAIGVRLEDVAQSASEIGERPATTRKTVLSKSEINERDIGPSSPEEPMQFSKAQALDAIEFLAMKGEVPTVAVSAYESTGYLPAEFLPKVQARLAEQFGNKK